MNRLLVADKFACAFDEGNSCSALNAKACEGCHFFKTEAALEYGRKNAEKRIKTLAPEHQRQIYDSYHKR